MHRKWRTNTSVAKHLRVSLNMLSMRIKNLKITTKYWLSIIEQRQTTTPEIVTVYWQ